MKMGAGVVLISAIKSLEGVPHGIVPDIQEIVIGGCCFNQVNTL